MNNIKKFKNFKQGDIVYFSKEYEKGSLLNPPDQELEITFYKHLYNQPYKIIYLNFLDVGEIVILANLIDKTTHVCNQDMKNLLISELEFKQMNRIDQLNKILK